MGTNLAVFLKFKDKIEILLKEKQKKLSPKGSETSLMYMLTIQTNWLKQIDIWIIIHKFDKVLNGMDTIC